jgi:predicted NBD/HSP70 family sugar kinase
LDPVTALRYSSELEPKTKRLIFHGLLNLAEEGNAHAVAALAKQAKYIGQGLRILAAALSPEIVLISGDITSAWDRFAPIIQAELNELIFGRKAPRLLPTHEGDVARLRGAAALLLQRHAIRSYI